MKRVVLTGTGSGVGKTTIATGIMKALSDEHKIQPFKVGPDYIDPSYHNCATGVSSRNLDSFFMSDGQIRQSFKNGMTSSHADYGIIEGVRGLYEGISPTNDIGSTSSIAKALNSPVILIINSRSLVRSAAAMTLGFKALDSRIDIEGVILNNVKSQKHYLKTKEAVEKLANTRVLGGIERDNSISMEQRHLGLIPAVEQERISGLVEKWGELIRENIDLDALMEIMDNSNPIINEYEPIWSPNKTKHKTRIAVPFDEAFNFYYKENLEALEYNNAKIEYFSPIHDEQLPSVDALYIGGGYPEIFKKELSKNTTMLESIKEFSQDNHPIYAECGGLMYLCKTIDSLPMVDVFPYHSMLTKRVQGLSYTIAHVQRDNPILKKNTTYHGHEFHYSKVEYTGSNSNDFAFSMRRGVGITGKYDGLLKNNTLASYIHTHTACLPDFGYNFTQSAYENK
ncbi:MULTISPECIES: Ni-sirohydrochlorin a,c-diamide synthase [Methanosphaera]|uniref:Cobyrinate a,c-diamide synthase n=2 Tax=Methanosphaera stadtmanae TaxID=2317 RepID=CBIA_METST|nr:MULTISPECIES: Ni-sirohydrochlorin a,c-diamide synthase [Methanosphaera]Q2NHQ3.1 RecName: Full=Cobyrinate a,c-diamide synthase; AltName: Full=Cobyrinic acid a,c-diamide synthetase; AltName: Full=Ni-sirohydrochlorin a,c-diamide synthase; AltName: Full=Ni-sirohydrochlorin a,c-diamide synthetase [Methanosphaera stadtmanae DSM 3091]ABC56580.1 CbiA [Methanosphaera stadtmanae DSM 3091]MEE0490031.1 Ni-sirohydrochlorin a,c-diamide synthase [Methanosphaera stadtmanae]OEC86031.1 cobyrinic acid a,c-diam